MIDDQKLRKTKPSGNCCVSTFSPVFAAKTTWKVSRFCLTVNMIVGDNRKAATGLFRASAINTCCGWSGADRSAARHL